MRWTAAILAVSTAPVKSFFRFSHMVAVFGPIMSMILAFLFWPLVLIGLCLWREKARVVGI